MGCNPGAVSRPPAGRLTAVDAGAVHVQLYGYGRDADRAGSALTLVLIADAAALDPLPGRGRLGIGED